MRTDRPSVLVTGSSGLLGHRVCERLAESGYEVFGFDRVGRPEPPKLREHVHDVECDLTNYMNVRKAVENVLDRSRGKLASVIHLAAYYDFSGADSKLYEDVTVNGTDRLLNALSNAEVDQFIFSSTMLVHQPCEVGEHIDENTPLEAKWPYPQSKIETERLIKEAHPSVNSVCLRIAGVYTDWGTQPTLVQQIRRIYEKDFESYVFPGDSDAGQSSVHLEDAVAAICKTVDRSTAIAPGSAFLIGESDPPSYKALQKRIGELIHGDAWPTLYVPPTVARVGAAAIDSVSSGTSFIKPFMIGMADDHYALDLSHSKSVLGWHPEHALMEHLPIIIENLKQDPDQWYRRNGLGGG
jgi:UDP-glucose 4-epimerase